MRAERQYQTFKPKLMAGIATLAVAGAGLVIMASPASAASSAPPFEPDPQSLPGAVVFYDAQGNVVTSGTNDLATPFAYAVATSPLDSGAIDSVLTYAKPTHGSVSSLWPVSQQTETFNQATQPAGTPADIVALAQTNPVVDVGTAASLSIFNYNTPTDPTPGYANTIEVRVNDAGARGAGNANSGTWWESDIAWNSTSSPITVDGVTVPANGWAQVFPVVTKTTTTLTTNAPTGGVGPGTPIKLTATDSDTSAAGTFNFYDGTKLLGSAAASGGSATFTYTPSAAESASFTASFVPTLGDVANPNTVNATMVSGSTSPAVAVTVTSTPTKTATTTTLTASPTTIAAGASDTLTATVTSANSNAAGVAGSVQFKVGGTAFGSPVATTVSGTTGTATLTTTTLPAGTDNVTAVFTPTDTTDYTGSTSSAVSVTVDTPPTVTTQPTSQTVAAGSNATFTVAGSGTPTPTVQWMSAPSGSSTFTDISGATSDTLTVSKVSSAENGTQYEAVLTNTIGGTTHTAKSNVVTLTVVPAPTITTQPSDSTVTKGDTATFTAAATVPGGATPTVQWESEAPNGTSFKPISGASSDSYTTPATGAADNGTKYEAVFTNTVNGVGATATSNPATLTVLVPATVATQPKSQTVTVGGTATFTAAGSGTAPVSVQWQSEGPKDSSFTPISGATSDTLTVSNVTLAESGTQYEAVFSNTINGTVETATSNPATLTVVAASNTLGTWSGAPGTAGSYVSAHFDVAPGTSPAVTTLSTGKEAIAFQGDGGMLWTWVGTPGTTGTAISARLGMKARTSPSIIALSGGKAAVAFQANTGKLWTWRGTPGTGGGAGPTAYGMAAGTSPSVTTFTDGRVAVAFQANTGKLWTWRGTPGTGGGAGPTSAAVPSRTSPAVATLTNGEIGTAF